MTDFPQFRLLSPWPMSKQKEFIYGLSRVHFSDAETVFERGDKSTDVYFIISGEAKSLNYNSNGKVSYFRIRQAGDCFGYYSAISGEPRTATMIAVGETELARISGEAFFSLVLDDKDIGRNFLKLVVGLLRIETDRLTNMTTLPTQQRVAAEILAQCMNNEEKSFSLPDRDEFASYLGMTRETLSRALSNLAKHKFVSLSDKDIKILDIAGLQLFVESVE